MQNSRKRSPRLDNLRLLLIALVVFAHFLELFPNGFTRCIYSAIYVFHMPALLLISGCCAGTGRKRFWSRYVLPYVLFQTFYLVLQHIAAHGFTLQGFALQYMKPYKHLWYLMACMYYVLLLPVLPERGSRGAPAVVLASVVIALMVGFSDTFGYPMSLSRAVVFAPFYLTGYYAADYILGRRPMPVRFSARKRAAALALCLAVLLTGTLLILLRGVSNKLLYGSTCYSEAKNGPLARLTVMVTAAAWIGFLFAAVPDRQIPLLTPLGQDTMAVYLLHCILYVIGREARLFRFSTGINLLLDAALTGALIALLCSAPVRRILRPGRGNQRALNH